MKEWVVLTNIPEIFFGGGERWGLFVAFLAAAAVVVLSGTKLSRYGDALGERTGLGSGLVGLLFLAAVTSLPELVVSTTATLAASLQAAGLDRALPDFSQRHAELLRGGSDLAVGNMIGSNCFNLMLFVLMDFVYGRRGAFSQTLSRNHIMSAASGLGLLGLLLFGFAVCNRGAGGTGWVIPVLEIGPVTPLLLFAYLAVMVSQGKLEKKSTGMEDAREVEAKVESDAALIAMPAFRFYGTILLFAALIVAAGMWLSLLGDRIALPAAEGGFGLGQSFVGSIFLAVSTSLPELVVSVAAVRMGCNNMAAGNILGSNIFNLVIVFTSDLGLRGGSILHYASLSHLFTIGMTMMLTSAVIAGIVYRGKRNIASLGLESWLMLGVYVAGNLALYFSSVAGR